MNIGNLIFNIAVWFCVAIWFCTANLAIPFRVDNLVLHSQSSLKLGDLDLYWLPDCSGNLVLYKRYDFFMAVWICR